MPAKKSCARLPAKNPGKALTNPGTCEVREDVNVNLPLINTTGMVIPGSSAGTSSGTSAGTSSGPSANEAPVCNQYVCLSVCESGCEFVS